MSLPRSSSSPSAFWLLAFWLSSALLLVLLLGCPSSSEARPSALDKTGAEGGEMTDALKYLDELDKYYSQVARPRERRVGQNMASAIEKLSKIKNYYNEAGRPRFGKRSGYPAEILFPAGYERWRR